MARPETPTDEPAARFRRAVEALAPRAARFVLALSGGGDSVAALRLAHAAGLGVVAAHFDHRLRPGSDRDAAFARELCAALGVELLEESADVAAVARQRGWNVEDAARRLRYAFLYRALRERAPGGAIIVAHTLEDQAETVLLQLLRGTAHPAGMRARQRAVIRPLLGQRRAELRAYLRELGQEWREDATNLGVDQSRAWLRNDVLPRLEARFPAAQERLAATAYRQQEARSALQEGARRRFPAPAIRLAAFSRAPAALRKTALAERLRAVGAAPSARLLDEIDAAAVAAAAQGAAAPPWRVDVPGGGEVSIAYGELRVAPAASDEAPPAPVAVTSSVQLPAGVSADVLRRHEQLTFRGRAPGDRIRLPAGSKLVSDLLIDRKVPRARRARLRVLAAGADVLWVEGVAVAAGASERGAEPQAGAPFGAGPPDDRRYMRLALEQARLAAQAGEVPIGAVVVAEDGRVLAAAHNRTEADHDPTAHAELLALKEAAAASRDWRLAGATLYVTLEPCPMCLGAVLQTHLASVVFGADNVRDGALGGVTDLTGEGWKRVPAVRGGVEAAAAARLLKEAFAARRERPD